MSLGFFVSDLLFWNNFYEICTVLQEIINNILGYNWATLNRPLSIRKEMTYSGFFLKWKYNWISISDARGNKVFLC